jgi:uncharacterized protein (TIGR02145 family)
MQKSAIIIFLLLVFTKTQGQDYYISFTGSGSGSDLDIVKVNNLTSGAQVTFNGGDILHLILPVGIGPPDIADRNLQIYPNPMTERSMVTFIAPRSGNMVLSITDLSGRTVCQVNTFLSGGTHSFGISRITQGIYFVKIAGDNYTYTKKLVSQSKLRGKAVIEYLSSDLTTKGNLLKNAVATIDMPYNNGDLLLYKGTSSIYSTIVTDVPTGSKTVTFNLIDCTDQDSNHYATLELGTQIWMAENLNVGTRINGLPDQTNNNITEKYCYDDNDSNCAVYGGLYQWDEAMQYSTTPGVRGICPTGWHLPSDDEWATFTTFLGGEDIAGGKMKETDTIHWVSPNFGATNSSGFTALPGGMRNISGGFTNFSYTSLFWSSSESPPFAWLRFLDFYVEQVFHTYGSKLCAYSVRCIKD